MFTFKAKIHSELDAIFSDDMTRDITIDDLRQLKYLEQCIKESLRLYPSVPYVARNNNEPIRIDNYEVPARTTCMVFFYMLHRDPHYYPNPEVFDPNRFDTDATGGQPRHPYAYVPFSAGPRNCIGQKFALLEEKALLAAVLRRYDIRCLTQRHDLKLDIAAILKPNSNITMRFAKRF
jgi:cytochrome P450 family 4